jgi:hypothetical protein
MNSGVSIEPGAMAFTRIFFEANSLAATFVIPTIAHYQA